MSTELKQESPESILKSVDAWLTGHFLYTSGKHGDHYIQCQKVLQYPRMGLDLADRLAKIVIGQGIVPESVVGPALGAIHWECFMASALDKLLAEKSDPVRGIFAERPAGSDEFSIRRGIEIKPGEKILVVEDVTTTGGSVRKIIDLVKSSGGQPIAVAALVDRSGGTIDFGIPFFKLITLSLQTFEPEDCPLCKQGSKAIKPGSSNR